MPDLPDITQPLPDRAHESLRQSVVDALEKLELQVQRLDRAFLLLLGAGQGMQGTLNVVESGQEAIAALQAVIAEQQDDITALKTQVAALTPPPAQTPIGGAT